MRRYQPAHWVGGIYSKPLDMWLGEPPVTESEMILDIDNAKTVAYISALSMRLETMHVVDSAIERMMKCKD